MNSDVGEGWDFDLMIFVKNHGGKAPNMATPVTFEVDGGAPIPVSPAFFTDVVGDADVYGLRIDDLNLSALGLAVGAHQIKATFNFDDNTTVSNTTTLNIVDLP